MAKKNRSGTKTSVVSVRISDYDKRRWEAYCILSDLSLNEFFSLAMISYLEQEIFRPLYNAELIRKIEQLEARNDTENSDETVLIHFRLKESLIQQWDALATQMYFSRSSLVVQVTRYFYRQDLSSFPKPHLSEIIRLIRILNNVIEIIGILSFQEVRLIFEDLDQNTVVEMLDKLEQKGLVGRKGYELYVPLNPRSETLSTRLVAEILDRINDQAESTPNPVDLMDPGTVLRPIFRYFELLKHTLDNKQYVRDVEAIDLIAGAEYHFDGLKQLFNKLLNLSLTVKKDS